MFEAEQAGPSDRIPVIGEVILVKIEDEFHDDIIQSEPIGDPLAQTPTEYECSDCGYKCSEVKQIKEHHENVHSGSIYYNCSLCDKVFCTKIDLDIHVKFRHVGEKPFACTWCEYKAKSSRSLSRHMKIHSGKTFSCDLCPYTSKSKDCWRQHLTIKHSNSQPFVCCKCGFKTMLESYLELHMRIHTGEKPVLCNLCGVSFRTLSGRHNHMKTVHSSERPFSCASCGFKTKMRSGLKSHMKTHSQEKPFKCALCDFGTKNKSSLKRHLRIHAGDKPYSCDLCEFRTATQAGLVLHSRQHTGEKPFLCDVCGYSSASRSNLKTHERTHTGEKPFLCRTCGTRFTQSSSLKSHTQRFHPECAKK